MELRLTGAEARDTIVGEVPPAPTAEAREMVDKAAERVEQLHARIASCTSRASRARTA